MGTSDRLHALDAVRGLALVLGIFFHGAAAYIENYPQVLWPVREPPSTTLAVLFFTSHMFRMSLFFLIAGLFGRMVLERRGVRAFVRDRAKRILVPLVVGLPVVLVLGVLLFVLGARLGGFDLATVGSRENTLSWAHLWFLYYLLIFYVAALALRAVGRAVDPRGRVPAALDAVVRVALGGVWGAALVGLPLAVYFARLPGWASWVGLPPPLWFVTPYVPSLVGYGTAFAFGWLAHRQTDRLLALEGRWRGFIALAVLASVVCFAVGGLTPRFEPHLAGRELAIFAAAYFVGAWAWIFGLIGLALRFLSKPSPERRYLADSSYWLYLMHLPVLAFFATSMNGLPWDWSVKYPLQIAATIAVLLVSYRYLVRPTFIGAILNGRRYPRGARAEPAAAPTPAA